MSKHRWSGWPGAYCMKCGAEQALENAIGMNWYDPYENTWDTKEHEKIVSEADGYCPIEEEKKEWTPRQAKLKSSQKKKQQKKKQKLRS